MKSFEITLHILHTVIQFISAHWDKIEIYIRRIPRIAIHFCPKMVTFESGPKVVAIDEIW